MDSDLIGQCLCPSRPHPRPLVFLSFTGAQLRYTTSSYILAAAYRRAVEGWNGIRHASWVHNDHSTGAGTKGLRVRYRLAPSTDGDIMQLA